MKTPIPHPDNPPEWLASWITEADLAQLFAPGIRRYAFRAALVNSIRRIDWAEDRLIFEAGQQHCEWRLGEGGRWTRTCSCAYKTDCCVHSFLAAKTFNTICRQMGWLAAADAPESHPAPGRPTNRKAGGDGDDRTLSAAADGVPSHSSGDMSPIGKPDDTPTRLEVEADFRHQTGRVGLRFYRNQRNRRELMRMQQLFNLGMALRSTQNVGGRWEEYDRRFLIWFSDRLRGRPALLQNLTMYNTSEKEFENWQKSWSEYPGRFIERETQEVLFYGKTKGTMFVELSDAGTHVWINPVVVTESGEKHPFYEIFRQLANGQRSMITDGRLLDFTPPLSWQLLCEVFSERSPRLRKEHVPEHLPNLI